jgi:hypothetical protein
MTVISVLLTDLGQGRIQYRAQGALASPPPPSQDKTYRLPSEKERVRAWFIVENTRFLHQISCVLPHGTTPNRLLPVRSKIKLRQERFDSVRIRTFGY